MRKVIRLFLKDTLFITGVGDCGPQVPPSNKTIPGLDMTAEELGVLIKSTKGITTFVPWSAVKSASVQEDAPAKTTTK